MVTLNKLWSLEEVQLEKGQLQNQWHKYDVYGHTGRVVGALKERNAPLELLAAGILHDIGKPVVATMDIDKDGNPEYANSHVSYSFKGHEEKGYEMIMALPNSIFSDLNLDKNKIAEIVRKHYIIQPYVKQIRNSEKISEKYSHLNELNAKLNDGVSPIKNELLEMYYADTIGKGFPELNRLNLAVYNTIRYQNNEFEKFIGGQKCSSF